MERCSAYVIVSEGSSERAYIQQLRSFLANRMPVGDDFRPRLDLMPKVTNNGAGGGQFSLVQQTYRKCRKADKHTPIMVWVDADIYVRNDGAVEERNAKSYAGKRDLPDFLFSVMNFEDFLALHFADDIFEKWYETFSERHFKTPMHGYGSCANVSRRSSCWTRTRCGRLCDNLSRFQLLFPLARDLLSVG